MHLRAPNSIQRAHAWFLLYAAPCTTRLPCGACTSTHVPPCMHGSASIQSMHGGHMHCSSCRKHHAGSVIRMPLCIHGSAHTWLMHGCCMPGLFNTMQVLCQEGTWEGAAAALGLPPGTCAAGGINCVRLGPTQLKGIKEKVHVCQVSNQHASSCSYIRASYSMAPFRARMLW